MATGNPQDPWPADLRTFAISRRSPLARRQDLAQVDVARPTGLLVYLQSSYTPICIPRRERFFPPRDHHQPRHAPGVEPEARDVAQGARTSGRFARRVDRRTRNSPEGYLLVQRRAHGEAARRALLVPLVRRNAREDLPVLRAGRARGRGGGRDDSPSSICSPTDGRAATTPGARDSCSLSGGTHGLARPRVARARIRPAPRRAH